MQGKSMLCIASRFRGVKACLHCVAHRPYECGRDPGQAHHPLPPRADPLQQAVLKKSCRSARQKKKTCWRKPWHHPMRANWPA